MIIIYIQFVQSVLEYIGYFIPASYQNLLTGPLITYYVCLTITLASIPFLFVLTFNIKLKNIILCYLGLATFCISLIFIMPYYEKINAAGMLPVFMGVFLLGLFHSITRKNFIGFTCWLPFSKRRRMINRLIKLLITVCEDGVDIVPEHEYDSIVRQHALELFKGDEAQATHWLQSYQPPLYSD